MQPPAKSHTKGFKNDDKPQFVVCSEQRACTYCLNLEYDKCQHISSKGEWTTTSTSEEQQAESEEEKDFKVKVT